MRISLLVPTRKRPDRFTSLYRSAMELADNPEDVEFVAFIDDDDASYDGLDLPRVTKVRGSGLILAEMWNECAYEANGDYLGLVGDDVLFRTKGWDTAVLKVFDEYDDKIAYVFGDDLSPRGKEFGTHGFIHRNWALTVGYFVPPYFAADYVDAWLNDVAREIGRLRYADIVMEHMHFGFGKSKQDDTYREGRRRTANTGTKQLYESAEMKAEREKDMALLRQFMGAQR